MPQEATDLCDQVAYQFAGSVQSHVALVVVDAESLRILQASNNLEAILGKCTDEAVGERVCVLGESLAGVDFLSAVRSAQERKPLMGPVGMLADGRACITRHHRLDGRVCIEIEPSAHEADVPADAVAALLPSLLSDLAEAETVNCALEATTSRVRSALGYDRCMIYRFDADWNGEVIGEDRGTGVRESFLGLRFPARDIPPSVRTMMSETPVRMTMCIEEDGAALVPLTAADSDEHTDLTHVRARHSVGPCRDYYRNLGVVSTLVVPVLREGVLWGMISLHHGAPRRVSPVHDTVLKGASIALADALSRIEELERREAERLVAEMHAAMAHNASPDESPRPFVDSQLCTLSELLACDAIVMSVGVDWYAAGELVERDVCDSIVRSLSARAGDEPTACSCRLAVDDPGLEGEIGWAAGGLAVRIGESWSDYLLAIRAEKSLETRWAGDPRQGLGRDEHGQPQLTPRNSFREYIAATALSSREWTSSERHTAQSCGLSFGLRLLRHQALVSVRTQAAFLANMSHEIRTPMTAILGFADVLVDDTTSDIDDSIARDAVSTIRNNAAHLLAIINDLLDVSKVDAGKLSVERIETDVIDVVHGAVELMRGRASEKGLSLSVEHMSSLPASILSDPTRLKQIVLNLVGNAVKFTDAGSVTVRLAHDPATRQIQIEVEDTGIGMTGEQLEVVRRFDTFAQADTSTTRRFGGTGLGLSISNSLARLLGGRLEVESEWGAGSRFRLTLPAIAESGRGGLSAGGISRTGAPRAAERDAALDEAGPSLLSGVRVLVVEDGPDNRRLIEFHLKRAGADVELAENGRVAIERIGSNPAEVNFDLILMDMQMPEMDGYEATRWLRAHGHRLPVVALTAHAMSGDREKCIEAGCNDFQTKPIDAGALVSVIREWARDYMAAAG